MRQCFAFLKIYSHCCFCHPVSRAESWVSILKEKPPPRSLSAVAVCASLEVPRYFNAPILSVLIKQHEVLFQFNRGGHIFKFRSLTFAKALIVQSNDFMQVEIQWLQLIYSQNVQGSPHAPQGYSHKTFHGPRRNYVCHPYFLLYLLSAPPNPAHYFFRIRLQKYYWKSHHFKMYPQDSAEREHSSIAEHRLCMRKDSHPICRISSLKEQRKGNRKTCLRPCVSRRCCESDQQLPVSITIELKAETLWIRDGKPCST